MYRFIPTQVLPNSIRYTIIDNGYSDYVVCEPIASVAFSEKGIDIVVKGAIEWYKVAILCRDIATLYNECEGFINAISHLDFYNVSFDSTNQLFSDGITGDFLNHSISYKFF